MATGSSSSLHNILVIFLGIVILGLHIGLIAFNKHIFNLVVALYVIAYSIIYILYAQRKKDTLTNVEYNMIIYASFFVISLEVVILAVAIIGLLPAKKTNVATTTYTSPYTSTYKF